jgi:polygalacturonase
VGAMKIRALEMFFRGLRPGARPIRRLRVTAFGAKNDASARSTKAIRDAIQACAKRGGGTVYFPPGTYETGAIELASNLTVQIDAGATVRFHTDLAEYPVVPGRYVGTEGLTLAPLVGGRNLQNVTITGRGTLTIDNAAWLRATNNSAARAMWTSIQNRLEKRETVPEEDYRQVAPSLRPSFIRPVDSKNILIEGIHVVGSSMWVIHLLYCENVVLRNVIVETDTGANTNGLDIESSREIRLRKAKVPAEMHIFENGPHGVGLDLGDPALGLWPTLLTN